MPEQQNVTNIPSNRVEFIDSRTGLVSREWYRFFLNLFNLAGSGGNQTSLDDLQVGPPPLPTTTSGGGSGTVTSIDVSGGTTGLTTSGGPITSSGTITLAGTLAVANGGTGVITSTGTGSVVLNTSPTLVTPILGTPQSGNFSTGTFTWPTFNQNTTGQAGSVANALTSGTGVSFSVGTTYNGSTAITIDNSLPMVYPGAGIPNSTGTAWGTSYTTTGSGTVVALATSPSFTTPILGTPTSGNFSTGTFTWPTFNQNTTGSAATLTTPRAIYGNNFDGSAALTQIIASTYGGTGNGFTKFSGATTAEKTYSLPDATTTILTTNAAVTIGQGGTGQTTATAAFNALSPITSTGDLIIGNGTNSATRLAIGTINYVLTSNGTTATWAVATGSGATITNDTSTSTNVYPLFAAATSGSLATAYTSNANYLYKPSTGELTAVAHVSSNGIQINANTIATSYTIAATNNGLSAGPVSVNSGVVITVSSGSTWVIV